MFLRLALFGISTLIFCYSSILLLLTLTALLLSLTRGKRGVRPTPPLLLKQIIVIDDDLSRYMSVQLRLLPGAISDLFAESSNSNQITLADQYGLLAALLEDSITEEERASIDRMLYSLHRSAGCEVVSEISAMSYISLPLTVLLPQVASNN